MKRNVLETQVRQAEFVRKLERIRALLNKHGWAGAALHSQALFAWATAGGDNHVNQASESGIAHLLVTDNSVAVFANNIEIHRLKEEEFTGIDTSQIEFWSCPWYEDAAIGVELQRRMTGKSWVSDSGIPGSSGLGGDFSAMTYTLTDSEIERYRRLGRDCSLAMEEALEIKPGITENAIAGRICNALLDHGVRPHVILVAADERVYNYRHPIPTEKKFKKHLMAVLCGKRGGLIINLTRMLHAGKKLPDDLRRKHTACCEIDITVNLATRVGRPMKDVLADGIAEYVQQGFAGEWKLHHQGGPTGYQGRSYLGKPDEIRPVLERQAFAWNPSITGTKSEDTILVRDGGIEFLSAPTKAWPILAVKREGKTYKRADIGLI